MEVTHATDHITHAVIGGKQSMNFGISDDPAFFQILSSALYKNPELAMIRETICNAWDAHIDAGISSIPLKITLKDDYLIIQDFGHGIPDDLIQPIYGIYGASTKKNDKRQTGGFGLGCKSPFAYTDHFEVTSCHNGVKTIYNMSKSSAELQGKPSIVPIASFPTSETGITVKIPINHARNNMPLRGYIMNVVYNGDILANFTFVDDTGEMERIGMEKSEHDMVMLPSHHGHISSHIKTPINVRYGNVIYPVEIAEEYKVLFQKCESLLTKHYNCRLVMQAPADSLSITPSREALTNSDITITTISNLLGKFLSVFMKNQQLLFKHTELVNGYVDEAADREASLEEKLPMGGWFIPGIPEHITSTALYNMDDFAKLEVQLRYSGRKALKAKKWLSYIQRYMHRMNEKLIFDRGTYQSWARTFQKHMKRFENPASRQWYYDRPKEEHIATKWWLTQIVKPLYDKLSVVPKFNRKNMYYCGRNTGVSDYNKPQPVLLRRCVMKSHTANLIHLLEPVVVLTHNAELLHKRILALSHDDAAISFNLRNGYYVYEVSRRQDEFNGVQDALSKIKGITVVDLTGRTKVEQAKYEARQEEIAKARADKAAGRTPSIRLAKKVKPGYFTLTNLIRAARPQIDTMIFTEHTDPARIHEPKAVMLISTGEQRRHHSFYYDEKCTYYIAKLYGDEVVVTNKTDVLSRIRDKTKAMDIRDYLFDKLIHDVLNSPSLKLYHSSSITKINSYIDEHASWDKKHRLYSLIRLLTDYPALNMLVADIHPLSDEDKMRWHLWEDIQYTGHRRRDEYQKAKAEIEAVPLKKEIADLLNKLIANPFLALIDVDETAKLMRNSRSDPAMHQKLIDLLTTIIK